MRIDRGRSRPLFRKEKRRLNTLNTIQLLLVGSLFGIVIALAAASVFLYKDELQLAALDTIGMAPTATPFASELAIEGMAYYQAGDVDRALSLMERAVRQSPNNVNYLYEYGILLIEGNRAEEVLAIGEKIIELAPDDPRGYVLKGRVLMYDDPSSAIQITMIGKDVDPDFAPLYAIQGVAYTQLGRWQQGIQEGRQAVELAPNDPFVLRAIFTPLVYIGSFEEAVHYLEDAISINPNLTGPYFELAALYRHPAINDPEMAVALYHAILELEPDSAKAYLRLCETYASVDEAQFNVAQRFCETAIDIDPQYGSAYMQRGRIQYVRRNYEGSIESFQMCIELGAENIECWYLQGLAQFFLSNCDEAWDLLQEANVMGQNGGAGASVLADIEIGLENITVLCPGYDNRVLPTSIPPTSVPATPIGGFG